MGEKRRNKNFPSWTGGVSGGRGGRLPTLREIAAFGCFFDVFNRPPLSPPGHSCEGRNQEGNSFRCVGAKNLPLWVPRGRGDAPRTELFYPRALACVFPQRIKPIPYHRLMMSPAPASSPVRSPKMYVNRTGTRTWGDTVNSPDTPAPKRFVSSKFTAASSMRACPCTPT